jgi:type IV pilus assembly protein PilQ
LYNVTVHEALDAILKVNGYVYKEEGNFIYVYTAKEAQELEKANRVANTEVFRMFYIPVADASNMIKPMLSEVGQVAFTKPAVSGIDSGTSDAGGDSHANADTMVITDYPENLDRIRKVLKDIDHRPQQILVEATILRAALNDDNALGIDFNIVGGVDFASLTSNSGQIGNANIQTGTITSNSSNVHSVGTGNAFTRDINNGLKVGFVSNNVSLFVSALEGITDTTVLANPKVLALNKQRGEVIVGSKTGYLTTTTTDTSTVQTVEFLDTGTRLVFRPFIGDDGYIRMEIHPEDSTGGLSNNLPFKITTEVTSNIMVKDGRTIVIGGLFREDSTRSRSQIPGLGNLPIAGPLFRQQRDTTRREEIIILLTPHIVKDDVQYSEASEEMMKHFEQLRVGVRKGMMWWGRERLAEAAYESAVAEMNKSRPNRGKALWHLDSATNLNPKFHEAIQMKQELTGKELSSVDNSTIRSFVRRQIMQDRAAATQRTSNDGGVTDSDWCEPVAGESSSPSTQPSDLASVSSTDSAAAVQPMFDESAFSPATQPSSSDGLSNLSDELTLDVQPQDLPQDVSQDASSVSPATQPAVVEIDQSQLSLTSPATQPALVQNDAKLSWNASSMFSGWGKFFWNQSSSASSPATQPSELTVTELPTAEEPSSEQSGDHNK